MCYVTVRKYLKVETLTAFMRMMTRIKSLMVTGKQSLTISETKSNV